MSDPTHFTKCPLCDMLWLNEDLNVCSQCDEWACEGCGEWVRTDWWCDPCGDTTGC